MMIHQLYKIPKDGKLNYSVWLNLEVEAGEWDWFMGVMRAKFGDKTMDQFLEMAGEVGPVSLKLEEGDDQGN